MKWRLLFLLLCISIRCISQETDPEPSSYEEHQLESDAEMQEEDFEDDSETFRLAALRKHPIVINEANESQLRELPFLHELQLQSLLQYRKQLGKLLSLYELQAVPGWDMETIRRLLPYIVLGSDKDITADLKKRFVKGSHFFLARIGRQLEPSAGFKTNDSVKSNRFLGSAWRVMSRYQYNYKNQLQYGILADKDAGEQFFKGTQSTGFDHYSFHLFARNVHRLKSIAAGDYTVNLGQGLIHWQGTGFSKSSSVLSVKKQGHRLRPYTSSGEFNFHRGVAVEFGNKRWNGLLFASARAFNANISDGKVSSLLPSGMNRTSAELLDRKTLKTKTGGGSFSYDFLKGRIAINAVHYRFSKPFQKNDEPYNLFALRGPSLTNISMDYSYTYNNIHVFGEVAVDHDVNLAQLHGMLASVDQHIDVSVVYRRFDKRYKSLFSRAFAEGSTPSNEYGLYLGLSTRPAAGLRVDVYADMFRFPWLKFRIDAPMPGHEYLLQLTYTPTKKLELLSKYRVELKAQNQTSDGLILPNVAETRRMNWRTQITVQSTHAWRIKHRIELAQYRSSKGPTENGFLSFLDAAYKPMMKKQLTGSVRIQYFETDGFNARVFAFENDLPFSYSVPFYYDRGFRWYLSLRSDLDSFLAYKATRNKSLSGALLIGQTIYPGKQEIGTGLTSTIGNRKTEFRLQLVVKW